MIKDDIIRMAREAGFIAPNMSSSFLSHLERFASLVAAAEREACAKVAEWEPCVTHTPQRIAAAIRARGGIK